MPQVKQKARRREDLDHFIERFVPVMDEQTQETLKQFCWTKPNEWDQVTDAVSKSLLWTMLDCEGKMYLAPGLHRINRMFYVICEKPYKEGERDYFYA